MLSYIDLEGWLSLDSNVRDDLSTQAILSTINEKHPRDLKELLLFLQANTKLTEKDVLKAVIKLQKEGKIRLNDSYGLSNHSFSSYLKSTQALWFWVSIAIALTTMLVSFFINEDFYPWYYLRNMLGLIFVLWLPGYTFIKLLFPQKMSLRSSDILSNVEQIALGIVMSLALVALTGLILNFTPWGINLFTIIFSLLAVSLLFAIAAIVRAYLFQKS